MEDNIYTLTRDEIKEVSQTGRLDCPKCEKGMRLLTTGDNKHNEFYCEGCHISAPLFQRQ